MLTSSILVNFLNLLHAGTESRGSREARLGVQVRTAGVGVTRKTFYKEPTLGPLQKQVRSVECSEYNGDLSTLDTNVNMVRIRSPPITVD